MIKYERSVVNNFFSPIFNNLTLEMVVRSQQSGVRMKTYSSRCPLVPLSFLPMLYIADSF